MSNLSIELLIIIVSDWIVSNFRSWIIVIYEIERKIRKLISKIWKNIYDFQI